MVAAQVDSVKNSGKSAAPIPAAATHVSSKVPRPDTAQPQSGSAGMAARTVAVRPFYREPRSRASGLQALLPKNGGNALLVCMVERHFAGGRQVAGGKGIQGADPEGRGSPAHDQKWNTFGPVTQAGRRRSGQAGFGETRWGYFKDASVWLGNQSLAAGPYRLRSGMSDLPSLGRLFLNMGSWASSND